MRLRLIALTLSKRGATFTKPTVRWRNSAHLYKEMVLVLHKQVIFEKFVDHIKEG